MGALRDLNGTAYTNDALTIKIAENTAHRVAHWGHIILLLLCLTGQQFSRLRGEVDLLCWIFRFNHIARYCTVSISLLQVSHLDTFCIY